MRTSSSVKGIHGDEQKQLTLGETEFRKQKITLNGFLEFSDGVGKTVYSKNGGFENKNELLEVKNAIGEIKNAIGEIKYLPVELKF